MTNEQTTPSKKITVGLILSWIFGILFALIGIISVFSEPIPGIVMLVMAAILLPPINKLVDEKWKFHLSGGIKTIVIIVGFIIFGSTVDTSNTVKQQNKQPEIQQKQEWSILNTEQQKDETKPTEEQPKTTNNEKSVKTEIVPTSTATIQAPTPTKTENKPASLSSETVSQKNAVAKAKSYLDYSGFSHDGLIAQLEYEQFSHADAVYGTDNSGANWNEQAAKKAKSYMGYSAFSRGSLIEQLKYEKFTQSQAEYWADAAGL
ncbi:MAG: protein of unknown function DUF1535 [uncultured bacterium (gcode 4)]|uniref:Putative host cell surface-exposed lipoprotein Ltp-like HTH region domain-containing protein n=1 Tax=uncultured bacterium (gcode 4) TaxID=1234023 RepID=K1YN50_9BACT|nr:MAG: protein of unknown function DUF1535 [uncultured bacterium (gcode 4)]